MIPLGSVLLRHSIVHCISTGTEHCVFVENIPPSRTRQDVWQYFKSFGPIRSLRMELPDGTLLLSDAEYGQLSSVNCHVRFRRRAEALAVTKALNRSSFKDRPISVQMAYQKYCNPDGMVELLYKQHSSCEHLLILGFLSPPSRTLEQCTANFLPTVRGRCGARSDPSSAGRLRMFQAATPGGHYQTHRPASVPAAAHFVREARHSRRNQGWKAYEGRQYRKQWEKQNCINISGGSRSKWWINQSWWLWWWE